MKYVIYYEGPGNSQRTITVQTDQSPGPYPVLIRQVGAAAINLSYEQALEFREAFDEALGELQGQHRETYGESQEGAVTGVDRGKGIDPPFLERTRAVRDS